MTSRLSMVAQEFEKSETYMYRYIRYVVAVLR